MEKNDITNIIIDGNQAVLCSEIFQEPQRLTPTGKISHAKTRVYTQRYRKEWEQMPDFKGWLTSVPCQDTRAFCTYCKKNLHAHRLSLLKHTCTMKHQRAALMYQAEMNEKKLRDGHGDGGGNDNNEKLLNFHAQFEQVNVQSIKTDDTDEDEDEDESDYNYVVERLEMEEEESCSDTKNQHIHCDNDNHEDNDDEDDDIGNVSFQLKLECSDDGTPCNKKIKLDTNERRDTLAEAMAHVHGEYMDNADDDHNPDLDMVAEPADHELSNNNHRNNNNNNNNNENNNNSSDNNGEHENDPNETENEEEDDKKTLQNIKRELAAVVNCSPSNESKLVAYQINSSQLSLDRGQQQAALAPSGAPLAIAPMQNKTIMLSSGKTVTLTTGKLPAGYVLSKVKGNLPTFVVAGSNKTINQRSILPKSQSILLSTPSQSQYELINDNVVAGTSHNADKKMGILKQIPIAPARISTHVLDTSKGVPIGGLQVSLYKLMDGRWTFLNESTTSPSGRCTDLVDMKKSQITAGRYKIHFDVDKYFTLRRIETMYPFIEIVFDVKNPTGNYHIPILLSPFSYTTYRGTDR